jgi:hypothetical protein
MLRTGIQCFRKEHTLCLIWLSLGIPVSLYTTIKKRYGICNFYRLFICFWNGHSSIITLLRNSVLTSGILWFLRKLTSELFRSTAQDTIINLLLIGLARIPLVQTCSIAHVLLNTIHIQKEICQLRLWKVFIRIIF